MKKVNKQIVTLWLGGMLLLTILMVLFIIYSRMQLIEEAGLDSQNLVATLQEHIRSDIAVSDRIMQATADEYLLLKNQNHQSEAGLRTHFGKFSTILDTHIEFMYIADADGNVVLGIDPQESLNIANSDYFIEAKNSPDSHLSVSKPLKSMRNNAWNLYFTRRMNNENGSFAGVVYIAYNLQTLRNIFSRVNIGPGGSIVLRSSDLGFLTRFPDVAGSEVDIGKPGKIPLQLRAALEGGAATGTLKLFSPTDNTWRISSFAHITPYPFIIIAGQGLEEILKLWYFEVYCLCGALLVVIILTWLAVRKIQHDSILRDRHLLALHDKEMAVQLFQNSPDPLLLVCDSVFVHCNRATEKLLQCERQEICGRRPEDFSPRYQPDGRLSSESAAEKIAKAHSDTHTFEWVHQRRDGSQFWANVSLVTFEMQGRQVVYSSLRDISVQKQLEQEQQRQAEELRAYYQKLKEQELFTHSTLDGLRAHICVINRQGEIILTNRCWEGFAAENGAAPGSCGVGTNYLAVCLKSCGESDTDFVHFADAITAVISGSKSGHRMEYPCHSPTEQRWFLCTINPFTVAGVGYAVISHENITDLKQIEAELIENEKQLHSFNDRLEIRIAEEVGKSREKDSLLQHQDKMSSLGRLAAGVAHEINNPMGYIISNLASLSKYVDKLTTYLDATEQYFAGSESGILESLARERNKYKIDRIRQDLPGLIAETREGADRVSTIVQDLKSFSRLDNSTCEFSDINKGLESTLSIAWNELKYKATVNREFGQLPPVWCNMGQLNQVFLNILVNAAHAIEGLGEIRIVTRAEAESVKIAISDSGCGIAPEHVRRIFDPFFTTKEVGKGTGLGLAIAYDIVVDKHGGSINVASEIGTGTTFTITLPVKRENEEVICESACSNDLYPV
ncbi:MAG: ATP-binding protein [Desulfuromonadaceae bacterium]